MSEHSVSTSKSPNPALAVRINPWKQKLVMLLEAFIS